MKKQMYGLCLLACLSISAFAQQNARVSSMGGTDIIPDISQIMTLNPVYMNSYKNQMQVTFNSPIIGIKSLGDVFSLGIVLNRGLLLDNSFYASAKALLPLVTNPAGSTLPIEYIPHLLLGFDFSSFQLGFDAFWEHSAYSTETIQTGTLNSKTTNDQSIDHIGAIAGCMLKLSSADLSFIAGIGRPAILGRQDNGVNVTEIKSDKGLAFRLGADLSMTMGNFYGTLGVIYDNLNYRFINATVLQPNITINTITPHIGFRGAIIDNILVVVSEKSIIRLAKTETPNNGPVTNDNSMLHTLSGGLEKQFANAWVLDSLGLRGGLSWSVYTTSSDSKATVGGTTTTINTGYVSKLGPANPYLGLGFSKKFFTLEVLLTPQDKWSGVVMGPPVSLCTATFKF